MLHHRRSPRPLSGYVPTTQSPAGEPPGGMGRPTHQQEPSRQSAQAVTTVAEYVPTTQSPAGDTTGMGRPTRRQGASKQSAQVAPTVAEYVPTTQSPAGESTRSSIYPDSRQRPHANRPTTNRSRRSAEAVSVHTHLPGGVRAVKLRAWPTITR